VAPSEASTADELLVQGRLGQQRQDVGLLLRHRRRVEIRRLVAAPLI
jgi:hypothetical protein